MINRQNVPKNASCVPDQANPSAANTISLFGTNREAVNESLGNDDVFGQLKNLTQNIESDPLRSCLQYFIGENNQDQINDNSHEAALLS